MTDMIRTFYERASELLDEIVGLTKGAKATLILRQPGKPEQDILLTDDDLEEAVSLIRRRQAAGAQLAFLKVSAS
jgi:hypothetical protein